jgi:hypothetical protein
MFKLFLGLTSYGIITFGVKNKVNTKHRKIYGPQKIRGNNVSNF